jgi:hypothetical protein
MSKPLEIVGKKRKDVPTLDKCSVCAMRMAKSELPLHLEQDHFIFA